MLLYLYIYMPTLLKLRSLIYMSLQFWIKGAPLHFNLSQTTAGWAVLELLVLGLHRPDSWKHCGAEVFQIYAKGKGNGAVITIKTHSISTFLLPTHMCNSVMIKFKHLNVC